MVSVVIPTINQDIHTLTSIPEGVPIHIEREGSLNEARNRGVETAQTERIIILDDDIEFETEFFWALRDAIEDHRLIGMADWDFGLVGGRVMGFTKRTFHEVGGFDECLESHMADTDFALKFLKRGWEIRTFNQNRVFHLEHERSVTSWDRTWRTLYLMWKHPTFAGRMVRGITVGVSTEQPDVPTLNSESQD